LQTVIAIVSVRLFVKRFALCYQTVVCLSVCPVCDVGVLWPNGQTGQDETWRAGRPRPWPHCVRWGPSFPSRKGAQLFTIPNFNFSAHVYCSQTAGWIKMPLGTKVGRGPGHIVLSRQHTVSPGERSSAEGQLRGRRHSLPLILPHPSLPSLPP